MMAPLEIRLADEQDLGAINSIYNYYVGCSTTTYDNVLWTIDQRRRWWADRPAIHPVTVACRDRQVVGWGALNAFRGRPGYRWTVENSVYVDPKQLRRGVGANLMRDLIDRAGDLGLRTIVAVVDAEQSASVAIHRRFGFREIGRLEQVGYKFDRWLDALLLQLLLPHRPAG
ncbi:MAG: N-acetyltransferase family protein [Planctomycetota bacterium]